jgi:hypothetical protein
VDRVHESVDRTGPVYRGLAGIATLKSSPELGLRPLRCPRALTEGRGDERQVGEPNGGVAAAQEAVDGRLTGGGSISSDG